MKRSPFYPFAASASCTDPHDFGVMLKAQCLLTDSITGSTLSVINPTTRLVPNPRTESVTDFLLGVFLFAKHAADDPIFAGIIEMSVKPLEIIESLRERVFDVNAYEAKVAQILDLSFSTEYVGGSCRFDAHKGSRLLSFTDGPLLRTATKQGIIEMLRNVNYEVFEGILKEKSENDPGVRRFLAGPFPLFRALSQLIDMLYAIIKRYIVVVRGDENEPQFSIFPGENKSFLEAYDESYAALLKYRDTDDELLPRKVKFASLLNKHNSKQLKQMDYDNFEAIVRGRNLTANIMRDAENMRDLLEAIRTRMLQELYPFSKQVAEFMIQY